MEEWEMNEFIPRDMFEETIVQYGERLNDCFKKMLECMREHHEVILMCVKCWNLIVSYSGMYTLVCVSHDLCGVCR